MSDNAEKTEVVETEDEQTQIIEDLKEVLKHAQINDIILRGLNQSVKTIFAGQAALCVLANDCDDKKYVQVVQNLCKEAKVPLFRAPTRSDLGQWVGLCKFDDEDTPVKIIKTSCVVVKKSHSPSEKLNSVLSHFKTD
ncbi:40S ribosomal protein S12 [Anaeramoeba ignava]|uniref:40S ribosomal protein S12 n=1 Tax=Anaeramoeba ignava TaxID=1746090 RepID=A0A9Q0L791_ANAIG|nr:40S ribosomal protein S12 [Anaeramoeba ignava]|eukprot:Anaeramoba_ignava/a225847_73.p1 GENE.a225847_73~~a225847_73.p1  ORF type:complete len:138 (-),score=33.03 a225847_73:280-693(-)